MTEWGEPCTHHSQCSSAKAYCDRDKQVCTCKGIYTPYEFEPSAACGIYSDSTYCKITRKCGGEVVFSTYCQNFLCLKNTKSFGVKWLIVLLLSIKLCCMWLFSNDEL